MKKIIFFLFTAVLSLHAAGAGPDTLFNTQASWSFFAGGRTNSLPASFYYRFHRGGFLDRPYLEKNAQKLKQDNIGGFDYKNGLYLERQIDSIGKRSDFFVGIRLEERYHVSTAFNSDLFKLSFFGNKIFEGATASAGPFNFRSLSYRYYGITFGKWMKKTNETYRISGELAYLEGRRGIEIEAKRATMTTATDGRFIQLDLQGSYYESDSTRFKGSRFLWPSSGNGFSGSIDVEWWQNDGHFMRFSARDIGFIDWKSSGQNYSADTALKFDGFIIPNVITYHDSLFRMSTDSLKRLNPEAVRSSKRIFLPAWFSMEYIRSLPDLPLAINVGITARAYTSYRPFLYSGCTWQVNSNAKLNLTVGTGGWGGINANASFEWIFLNSWRLQTGLMQLESVFSPRNVRGVGIIAGISKKFNSL